MAKDKVAIIGAGPGGLTAGMILANAGYNVQIFEKQDTVGGRNAPIEAEGYRFDIGPTFLMMKFILEEVFEAAGRNMDDLLDMVQIDPMYRLRYGDGREFFPTSDPEKMRQELERVFPGSTEGYDRYLEYERRKWERIIPCLRVPYETPLKFLHPRFLKALPYLDATNDLMSHLGKYFPQRDLQLSFTFQAKYLGMSPWKCPATFSIISFIEHTGGIYHPIGGLNQISFAMADVVRENGGEIHLSTPVKQLKLEGRKAVGVELENGDTVDADNVIVNADFGHAAKHLIPEGVLKKWSPNKLAKREVSCSGFLIYLGVKKNFPNRAHHSILFAPDYEKNVREIADTLELSEDPSIYVQNASVSDPTLAPEGHSTIYILVPIANNRSGIDWDSIKDRYRDKVLELVETRGGYEGLRDNIVVERILTPKDFENKLAVFDGAIFNLAHTMDQMLYFRPHNKFEEIDNCYLAGGGTHPGSGLPTIYQSGRISAEMIMKH